MSCILHVVKPISCSRHPTQALKPSNHHNHKIQITCCYHGNLSACFSGRVRCRIMISDPDQSPTPAFDTRRPVTRITTPDRSLPTAIPVTGSLHGRLYQMRISHHVAGMIQTHACWIRYFRGRTKQYVYRSTPAIHPGNFHFNYSISSINLPSLCSLLQWTPIKMRKLLGSELILNRAMSSIRLKQPLIRACVRGTLEM